MKRYSFLLIVLFFICLKNNFSQTSSLNLAVFQNNLPEVEKLLQNGQYPNKKDLYGNMPLTIAVNNSSLEMVKLLVRYGADKTETDATKVTYWMIAAIKNNIEIVKFFIDEEGADADAKDMYGKNALMYASSYKGYESNIELVKYLAVHGMDINMKDKTGRTALDYAQKQEAIDYLKSIGGKSGKEF